MICILKESRPKTQANGQAGKSQAERFIKIVESAKD
jgi:hypothetical protein